MPNKNLKSWIEVASDSDFTIHNIPFGIYNDASVRHRACSAIGDYIIDLYELAVKGLINADKHVLDQPTLNDFISLGKTVTNKVRETLIQLLSEGNNSLKNDSAAFGTIFKKQSAVKMLMPVRVGDYTD